jgi:hypothetical protein
MPDVYAAIAEADPGVIEQVAEAMEVSATDPQQAMVTAYLADVAVPSGARCWRSAAAPAPSAACWAARPQVGRPTRSSATSPMPA